MVRPGTRCTISGSASAGMASICFLVSTVVAAVASSRGSGTRAVTTISSRATCIESRSSRTVGAIALGVTQEAGSLPARQPVACSPLPVSILLLVILPKRSVLDRAPPRLVLAVPSHGAAECLAEVSVALEAAALELGRVERIAAVVALAVGHAFDQRLRLAEELEDPGRDLAVLALVAAADVVRLAVLAALDEEVDGGAVVLDEQPVAHVAAVAVERQREVVDRVRDEERDQLLPGLARPEVVRRARDDERQPVRLRVRVGHAVAAGLRRRVRIARAERIGLAKRAALDRAVDLIGGDLHEALQRRLARLLEQDEDAEDVGFDERVRAHERAVDVGLGGEVDDDVDAAAIHPLVRLGHVRGLGDVAVHEAVILLPLVLGEVLADAGVGELVEVDDAGVVAVLVEQETDEVRTDETGAAGDEVTHARGLLPHAAPEDDVPLLEIWTEVLLEVLPPQRGALAARDAVDGRGIVGLGDQRRGDARVRG